jgi:D-alanine-D-alanine ligase
MGGISSEREISLLGGQNAATALQEAGYDVTTIDVGADVARLLAELTAARPDIVFNALHGRYGEDGHVQALLNMLRIPYTHSGLLASALAMDKPAAKQIFAAHGIMVPEGRVISLEMLRQADPLPRPYVIKPPREGSSVGVMIVREGDNRSPAESWSFGQDILAEAYIPGRELTVAIINGRALAVTELRPRDGFYDYTNKYTGGKTEHLLPAPIPEEVSRQAMEWSEQAYRALGCRGVARTDLRYDDRAQDCGGLYMLEINTQPGMTALSLVPEQARYLGITYPELVRQMIEAARCD